MNPVFYIYTKYFIVPNSSYMRIQVFFSGCRHVPARFPSPGVFKKSLSSFSIYCKSVIL